MERVDCHCHTHFSDGTLSVEELLTLAQSRQLSGLSITDHDTIAAYETAIPLAKQLGLKLLSGIEISAEYKTESIHVLGYAFDLAHPELQQFCQRLQQDRTLRNQEILERLAKRKMCITLEELQTRFPHGTLGRPHIAALLVAKGYCNSMKQAFDRYLGEKKPCYVKGFNVEVPAAIELIQRAGGFAVLAHPHYLRSKRTVAAMLAMPFDGIEAYYGRLPLKQEQTWLKIADQKNWLITGGSDFHGEQKSGQSLGCSWTPPAPFAILWERFLQHVSFSSVERTA